MRLFTVLPLICVIFYAMPASTAPIEYVDVDEFIEKLEHSDKYDSLIEKIADRTVEKIRYQQKVYISPKPVQPYQRPIKHKQLPEQHRLVNYEPRRPIERSDKFHGIYYPNGHQQKPDNHMRIPDKHMRIPENHMRIPVENNDFVPKPELGPDKPVTPKTQQRPRVISKIDNQAVKEKYASFPFDKLSLKYKDFTYNGQDNARPTEKPAENVYGHQPNLEIPDRNLPNNEKEVELQPEKPDTHDRAKPKRHEEPRHKELYTINKEFSNEFKKTNDDFELERSKQKYNENRNQAAKENRNQAAKDNINNMQYAPKQTSEVPPAKFVSKTETGDNGSYNKYSQYDTEKSTKIENKKNDIARSDPQTNNHIKSEYNHIKSESSNKPNNSRLKNKELGPKKGAGAAGADYYDDKITEAEAKKAIVEIFDNNEVQPEKVVTGKENKEQNLQDAPVRTSDEKVVKDQQLPIADNINGQDSEDTQTSDK